MSMLVIAALAACTKPDVKAPAGDSGRPSSPPLDSGSPIETGLPVDSASDDSALEDSADSGDTSVTEYVFEGDLSGWYSVYGIAHTLSGGDPEAVNECSGDGLAYVDLSADPQLSGDFLCEFPPSSGSGTVYFTGTWSEDSEVFTVTFTGWGGFSDPSTVDLPVQITKEVAVIGSVDGWEGTSTGMDSGCAWCYLRLYWCAPLEAGGCPAE